jgi:hypothetical protein
VRQKAWLKVAAFIPALLAVSLSSCAQMMPSGPAHQQMASANAQVPNVDDCAVVTIGSPSKYACDGKVYTSFDLYKLRTGQK